MTKAELGDLDVNNTHWTFVMNSVVVKLFFTKKSKSIQFRVKPKDSMTIFIDAM
jgi:hypothetical protein